MSAEEREVKIEEVRKRVEELKLRKEKKKKQKTIERVDIDKKVEEQGDKTKGDSSKAFECKTMADRTSNDEGESTDGLKDNADLEEKDSNRQNIGTEEVNQNFASGDLFEESESGGNFISILKEAQKGSGAEDCKEQTAALQELVEREHKSTFEQLCQKVEQLQNELEGVKAELKSTRVELEGVKAELGIANFEKGSKKQQPEISSSYDASSVDRTALKKWQNWNVDMTDWRSIGTGPIVQF